MHALQDQAILKYAFSTHIIEDPYIDADELLLLNVEGTAMQ